jgi:hypothetical protein
MLAYDFTPVQDCVNASALTVRPVGRYAISSLRPRMDTAGMAVSLASTDTVLVALPQTPIKLHKVS